eukprot:155076-Pyramimonas_sp.AAC.1
MRRRRKREGGGARRCGFKTGTQHTGLLEPNAQKISLAKDSTICSCGCRNCEYRLRWSSRWGHEP